MALQLKPSLDLVAEKEPPSPSPEIVAIFLVIVKRMKIASKVTMTHLSITALMKTMALNRTMI